MFRQIAMAAALWLVAALSCSAAELGVLGGYSTATSTTATAGESSASVGFQPGAGVGAVVGDDLHEYFGGELRYLLLFDNLKISQGGTEATFSGRSHLIHYDFLFYARPRLSSVRPYLAGGGGVRVIEGTGAQQVYQPLSQYALLTQTRELAALISVGGGVKFKLSPRVNLRVEARDYISPHLSKVIAAPPGANLHGWIHDFVSLAGLTFTFH